MEFVSLLHDTDRMAAGNTPGRWLLALLAVAGTYALLLVWRNVIGRRFARLAARTETQVDDLVAELITTTSHGVLAALALYAGTLCLALPAPLPALAGRVALLAVLLQGGFWASRAVGFALAHVLRGGAAGGTPAPGTVHLLSLLARGVLWSVVLLLVLENLGIDVTAMVAGLGIGGIAVALALQNVLGDLLASFAIILDKPFVVGDVIAVGECTGTVEQIGIKTTRLRAPTGEQVIFANSDLLGSRIRNFQRMPERRVVLTFGIALTTAPGLAARVPELAAAAVGEQPAARFERCHCTGFADGALAFEAAYVLPDPDGGRALDVQHHVHLALLRRFNETGIVPVYPHRSPRPARG